MVEGGADTRVSFVEGYRAKERVRGMKGNSGNTGDDEVDEKKKERGDTLVNTPVLLPLLVPRWTVSLVKYGGVPRPRILPR